MMVHRVITPCRRCRGTGVSADPCPACGGSKRAKKERRISVKIPAGAPDGVRLRLAGCGQCGVKGGRPGDMYVSVRVEPSPIFDRDGNDIYFTAYVSPAVMALGGSAKIPTLYGYKEIKIEPGTRAGMKLRVAGYGVRTARGAGSMVIAVVPDIPAKLSDEQRKAWEKVAEAGGSGPGAEAAAKAAEEFYS
jgi:molecular chaperone DnaJ